MAEKLRHWAERLQALAEVGVTLTGPVQDDYAYLITTDPAVAQQFAEEFGFAPIDDDDVINLASLPRAPKPNVSFLNHGILRRRK
jgi:hypothetical protein